MNSVRVRNVEIGAGVPKICVPIVGITKEEIITEAKSFDSIPVDVVEWRVDWFENVFEFDKVLDVLKELRKALGETPILMTFRTSKEGGEKAIGDAAYAELNIVSRLRKMQDLGADIPKIAVMPQNRKDVLTLLAATEEMSGTYADRPIITMSMAGTGVISRLCGEVFGSALTFGAAKKASAPGQMGVNDLNTVLGLLHNAL